MYQIIAVLLLVFLKCADASPLDIFGGHKRHGRYHHHVRELNQVFRASTSTPANINDGIGNGADRYVLYLGDGTPTQGWPPMDEWVSFENMFNNNKDLMRTSCSNLEPGAPSTSEPEIGQIWNAVQSASYQSGVDHRFVFAVLMQESKGCTRIHTTMNSVHNPGLMQDHEGTSSCHFENGTMLTPCPNAEIFGMIMDGVRGTSTGDGLAGILNQVSTKTAVTGGAVTKLSSPPSCTATVSAATYYHAARIYNSGREDGARLEAGLGSTNCYASDIANRLTGWVWAASNCSLDDKR